MVGRVGLEVAAPKSLWEEPDFAVGGLAHALSNALSHGFGSCFPRGISDSCSLRAISGSGSGRVASFAKGDFDAFLAHGLSQDGNDSDLAGTDNPLETVKKLAFDTDLLWAESFFFLLGNVSQLSLFFFFLSSTGC